MTTRANFVKPLRDAMITEAICYGHRGNIYNEHRICTELKRCLCSQRRYAMIKEAICDAHLLVLVHVRPAEEARRGLDNELGVGDRDARLRRATDT